MTVVLFAALAVPLSHGADPSPVGHDKPSLYQPDRITWKDGPPSLPPGAKFAVLEGDLSKSGPFVFRVNVPDGYRIPPHTHPKPERVTVISDTFHLGMGDTFDASKAQALPVGTYGTWPPGGPGEFATRCSSAAVEYCARRDV